MCIRLSTSCILDTHEHRCEHKRREGGVKNGEREEGRAEGRREGRGVLKKCVTKRQINMHNVATLDRICVTHSNDTTINRLCCAYTGTKDGDTEAEKET